jgi:hypothetical protein
MISGSDSAGFKKDITFFFLLLLLLLIVVLPLGAEGIREALRFSLVS